eukprot:13041147-Ditylum_brightwellii.AAC.1
MYLQPKACFFYICYKVKFVGSTSHQKHNADINAVEGDGISVNLKDIGSVITAMKQKVQAIQREKSKE